MANEYEKAQHAYQSHVIAALKKENEELKEECERAKCERAVWMALDLIELFVLIALFLSLWGDFQ